MCSSTRRRDGEDVLGDPGGCVGKAVHQHDGWLLADRARQHRCRASKTAQRLPAIAGSVAVLTRVASISGSARPRGGRQGRRRCARGSSRRSSQLGEGRLPLSSQGRNELQRLGRQVAEHQLDSAVAGHLVEEPDQQRRAYRRRTGDRPLREPRPLDVGDVAAQHRQQHSCDRCSWTRSRTAAAVAGSASAVRRSRAGSNRSCSRLSAVRGSTRRRIRHKSMMCTGRRPTR